MQQPFAITVEVETPNSEGIVLSFQTYPNPTTDWLYLKIDGYSGQEQVAYRLTDMNGKVLLSDEVLTEETSIMTSDLAPATYFLVVAVNGNEKKTFKIMKNL